MSFKLILMYCVMAVITMLSSRVDAVEVDTRAISEDSLSKPQQRALKTYVKAVVEVATLMDIEGPLHLTVSTDNSASIKGRILSVSPTLLAHLSDDALVFVAAHELAHAHHDHTDKLFLSTLGSISIWDWFTGKSVQAVQRFVNSREFSLLSHEQEYESDRTAVNIINEMGGDGCSAAAETFLTLAPGTEASLTHPGIAARLKKLCSPLQLELLTSSSRH